MRGLELLRAIAQDDGTDGGGEFAQFVQRVADIPRRAGLEFKSDEECTFSAAICGFDEGFQWKVRGGYAMGG